MIELIEKQNSYAGCDELKRELLNKQIHIVCAAQNGLTHLNFYTELWCRIDKVTVNKAVEIINSKKETGTLYPLLNITILPKSEKKTDWNRNSDILSKMELKNCILDVFKANNEYIKCESIYFSLEPFYTNVLWAHDIIKELIENNSVGDSFVKRILISPFN